MIQDCVIGCFAGYAWNNVRVWARSLGASGFTGRKVALVRAPGHGCREALVGEGFEVSDFSHLPTAGTPYVERFSFLRRYLHHQHQAGDVFRWVVATDVRDVCFQRNPLDYLARFDPPRLVLSEEGLRYAHAEWNANNMRASFGEEALEMLRDVPLCNVGVLAGGHRSIECLAFLIEHLSRAARSDVSDQAALNLLVGRTRRRALGAPCEFGRAVGLSGRSDGRPAPHRAQPPAPARPGTYWCDALGG